MLLGLNMQLLSLVLEIYHALLLLTQCRVSINNDNAEKYSYFGKKVKEWTCSTWLFSVRTKGNKYFRRITHQHTSERHVRITVIWAPGEIFTMASRPLGGIRVPPVDHWHLQHERSLLSVTLFVGVSWALAWAADDRTSSKLPAPPVPPTFVCSQHKTLITIGEHVDIKHSWKLPMISWSIINSAELRDKVSVWPLTRSFYAKLTLMFETVLSTFSSKDLKLGEFLWNKHNLVL